MTRDEFLAALRATPREWTLYGHYLRCGDACPLTEVSQHGMESCLFDTAISDLEIDTDFGREVIAAADKIRGYNTHLRQELLEACGLVGEE